MDREFSSVLTPPNLEPFGRADPAPARARIRASLTGRPLPDAGSAWQAHAGSRGCGDRHPRYGAGQAGGCGTRQVRGAAGGAETCAGTTGNALLWCAALTGLRRGLAPWLVLRQVVPYAAVWIAVVGLGWVLGWCIPRRVGVNLSPTWSVVGSTGAWAFQVLTGVARAVCLRSA